MKTPFSPRSLGTRHMAPGIGALASATIHTPVGVAYSPPTDLLPVGHVQKHSVRVVAGLGSCRPAPRRTRVCVTRCRLVGLAISGRHPLPPPILSHLGRCGRERQNSQSKHCEEKTMPAAQGQVFRGAVERLQWCTAGLPQDLEGLAQASISQKVLMQEELRLVCSRSQGAARLRRKARTTGTKQLCDRIPGQTGFELIPREVFSMATVRAAAAAARVPVAVAHNVAEAVCVGLIGGMQRLGGGNIGSPGFSAGHMAAQVDILITIATSALHAKAPTARYKELKTVIKGCCCASLLLSAEPDIMFSLERQGLPQEGTIGLGRSILASSSGTTTSLTNIYCRKANQDEFIRLLKAALPKLTGSINTKKDMVILGRGSGLLKSSTLREGLAAFLDRLKALSSRAGALGAPNEAAQVRASAVHSSFLARMREQGRGGGGGRGVE